ncbi:MAG: DUF72 domain-containing protein [Halochromatium sp.]
MSNATMVTARGWWDLADRATFYPDDLPEDWQLAYFANCFQAVLLPCAFWSASDPSQVAQWRDEVPTRFRFLAEQASAHPAARSRAAGAPLQAADLEQRLGARLAAWLQPLAPPQAPSARAAPPVEAWFRYLDPRPHSRPDSRLDSGSSAAGSHSGSGPFNIASERYAVQAPRALHHDLRGAKHWLSELSAHHGRAPSLVILARPTSNHLSAWQELLDLLGLSTN